MPKGTKIIRTTTYKPSANFPTDTSALGDIRGLNPFAINSESNSASVKDVPWKNRYPSEVFFDTYEIDINRWNKMYPYRLLVVDVRKNNQIVSGSNNVASSQSVAYGNISTSFGPNHVRNSIVAGSTGLEYRIIQERAGGAWEAVLPITPQQLNITDQFAINTSATMRGIVEEHNGIKFKTISMAGTTGIFPKKKTIGGNISKPNSIQSIFGGTIEAAQSLSAGITRVAKAFNGQHPNAGASETKFNKGDDEFSTGYYEALFLGQFLERYAQAKKNPDNKGWRLVLDVPKLNQSFVVTPVTFTRQQSQQRPDEVMFNLQLKAWKRIDLKITPTDSGAELPDLSANTFQRIVNTIRETRRVMSRSTNLVKAIRSDFQKVFNVLRQASLAVKDLGGLAFTTADLPRQLVQDFVDTINDSVTNIKGAFKRPQSLRRANGGAGATSQNVLSDPKFKILGQTTATGAGTVVNAILDRNEVNEGLSREAVRDGALGQDAADQAETDSLNEIYANPEENFEFFDTISLDDINLSPQQEISIEDEIERIRLLTIDDFRTSRQELIDLALDISNNFGAGDQTFFDIYGKPEPKDRIIPMTIEENEILVALYDAIQAFDLLTATKQYDDFNIESPLEFVGGLANESGIDFENFESKFLVPVPFGSTVEEIAARYMGDADKWIEIVNTNGLRSPYIDEVGFFYDFLSNAEGRQFNVDDTDDRLFIGQRIILKSDTIPAFSRRIIDIEKIGDGNFLVTVDGLDDLDTLKTTENANMQGYLPGTVNSQNQIYIPSNAPSDPDDRIFEISHLDEPNLTKLSKVDFLLTDNNDIAINSIGDFRLANGLTNLVQALKLKVITRKGTLLRHLDFGLGIDYGISVADVESGAIIESLNNMIQDDSRFTSINRISININGSTMSIDMAVAIANTTGVVPISFDIRAS